MNIDQIRQSIENFLESQIKMNEFEISVFKDNGDSHLIIERKDRDPIEQMYDISEILNSYSEDWKVKVENNKPRIYVY
jgi:hypothetical protein